MSDVVLVALVGSIATIVSGIVGATAQPWITERIAKDRERRESRTRSTAAARQQLLDLNTAMQQAMDQVLNAASRTYNREVDADAALAGQGEIRVRATLALVPGEPVRIAASAFADQLRSWLDAPSNRKPDTAALRGTYDAACLAVGEAYRAA